MTHFLAISLTTRLCSILSITKAEMPTLPAAAEAGFKHASSYDKHRPSYPPSAVSGLLKNLGLDGRNKARIVDLAAGTGKFTELLSQRPESFEIIAVEPHDAMRGELEKKHLRGVQIVKGSSTDMPFNDGSIDAIIVAQVRNMTENDRDSKG